MPTGSADVWLVVCQDGDSDAVTLAGLLKDQGLDDLEVVLASQLVHGARWEHRVGTWGSRTEVLLADGRGIDSERVHGVLNRLWWVTAEGFAGASDADREYAGGELYALAQSWLEGFGTRAINRPMGLGLCGPWRSVEQWRAIARDHGLVIRDFPEQTPDPYSPIQVLIVDGEVIDHTGLPQRIREASLRLTKSLEHDLLELHFDSSWRFADATLMPALANGDQSRVAAVARALLARAS